MKRVKVIPYLQAMHSDHLMPAVEKVTGSLRAAGVEVEGSFEHTFIGRVNVAKHLGEIPVVVDETTLEDGTVIIFYNRGDGEKLHERITVDELIRRARL